jgi:hypothetical protein
MRSYGTLQQFPAREQNPTRCYREVRQGTALAYVGGALVPIFVHDVGVATEVTEAIYESAGRWRDSIDA